MRLEKWISKILMMIVLSYYCLSGHSQVVNEYLRNGWKYYESKDFKKAIQEFTKGIDIDATNYHLYMSRGKCKLIEHDYLGARYDLNKAISIDPNNPYGYVERARCNYFEKKFDAALKDISKAIDLDNTNSEFYYLRSAIKKENEDTIGSINDLIKITELGKEFVYDSYVLIAGEKTKLNDYKEAIYYYTKAIEYSPEVSGEDMSIYITRGQLKFRLKDYYGALSDLNIGIKYLPNEFDAYIIRSQINYMLKKFDEAILDCNTAIKLDAKNPEGYFERGLIKIVLRDKEGGCVDLSKAGELGSKKAYDYIVEFCNN
ncbi:MAG: hypothetical protein H6567_10055 [Lewinellaceae bacterium]|nr:hypothetical protein [Lewinellaceae bacterium]